MRPNVLALVLGGALGILAGCTSGGPATGPQQAGGNPGAATTTAASTPATTGADYSVRAGGVFDLPADPSAGNATINCDGGGTVSIAARGGTNLTISGTCTEVDVDSGGNDVKLNKAGSIKVHGSGNTVVYACGDAKVENTGTSNDVSQGGSCGGGGSAPGSPPAGTGDVVIGSAQIRNLTCNNNTVRVEGDASDVQLSGHCAALIVTGSANSIKVDSVDGITASGSTNHIQYSTGSPAIHDTGAYNVIAQG